MSEKLTVDFDGRGTWIIYSDPTGYTRRVGEAYTQQHAHLFADAPRLYEENQKLREAGSLLIRTVWDTLRHGLTDGQTEALEEAANEFKAFL